MNKAMVSVRLPSSLVEELRVVSKKDHFLDLSEAVRSIIRDNYLKHKDPAALEIQKLRKEISSNIKGKAQTEIISELKKIRDLLVKDEI